MSAHASDPSQHTDHGHALTPRGSPARARRESSFTEQASSRWGQQRPPSTHVRADTLPARDVTETLIGHEAEDESIDEEADFDDR